MKKGKIRKVFVEIDLFKLFTQILNPFVLIIIAVRMSIKKKIERSLKIIGISMYFSEKKM